MKKASKTFTIVLSLIVAFSMAVPVQAASKKSVYVCTKATVKDYSDGSVVTARFSYKKNGLLKKSNISLEDLYSVVNTYSYNGKSQIKQSKIKEYFLGKKNGSGKAKFKYTKKGHVKRIVVYNAKGKKKSSKTICRNGKDFITAEKEYNSKGKIQSTTKYTRNKKGMAIKNKEYNAKGKLTATTHYTIKGNTATSKKYNANGTLIQTSVAKYRNGNVISEVTYDETNDHEIMTLVKYSYKKVKTSKASKVKKQQDDVTEFLQQ